MSRFLVRYYSRVLVAGAIIALVIWNFVFFPSKQREFAQLHKGMTFEEVEELLGSEGCEKPMFISWPLSDTRPSEPPFTQRWEDRYSRIDVTFEGQWPSSHLQPKEKLKAEYITVEKRTPEFQFVVWVPQVSIVLALFAMLVFNQRTPQVAPTLLEPDPSSPKD